MFKSNPRASPDDDPRYDTNLYAEDRQVLDSKETLDIIRIFRERLEAWKVYYLSEGSLQKHKDVYALLNIAHASQIKCEELEKI